MVCSNQFILPIFILSANCYAQVCIPTAADLQDYVEPTDRFEVNAVDGVVLDKTTGLMWQQCEVGLNYSADTQTCIGNVQKLTWQQALLEANSNRHANYTDWHMPNIKELASIIDYSCASPALPNLEEDIFLFSDDQLSYKEGNYWTNTTVSLEPQFAWTFQISDGKNRYLKKTQTGRLRLVRYVK